MLLNQLGFVQGFKWVCLQINVFTTLSIYQIQYFATLVIPEIKMCCQQCYDIIYLMTRNADGQMVLGFLEVKF